MWVNAGGWWVGVGGREWVGCGWVKLLHQNLKNPTIHFTLLPNLLKPNNPPEKTHEIPPKRPPREPPIEPPMEPPMEPPIEPPIEPPMEPPKVLTIESVVEGKHEEVPKKDGDVVPHQVLLQRL